MVHQFTAIIQQEGDGYSALCPELDIASQGETVESAQANLLEAVELFFECAPTEEVSRRLGKMRLVTQLEVTVG
jgi:predicted RNase H-like HicB family nuclease